jgi:(4S)-4-hydroxy-5-phosphonooxypentane-2,3-dione isomerase
LVFSLNLLTLLKNDADMIVNCVYIHVKKDVINKFIEATIANHSESVKEPGNLRFDFIQQADDPCLFMLYEAFETESAAANHKKTEHYLKWRDKVADFMAVPRYGVKYNVVEPKDIAKW